MDTGSQDIIQLLEKYSAGRASTAEIDQLLTLVRTGQHDETVVSYIETHLHSFEPGNAEDIAFWKHRLEGGAQRITDAGTEQSTAVISLPEHQPPVHRVHFLRKWGWAAAAIAALIGIGAYLYTSNTKSTSHTETAKHIEHIPPGKNGAILTLADGSQLVLDSMGNGVVATQNGTSVTLKGGGLAYDPAGAARGEVGSNTMTTPKGRQFQITLPDGTRVWLNAASSLRYPTVFAGDARQVYVTGEAYFEVARNISMPFKVNVNGKAAVEVLGTHFNVNAYDNENAINTTLLNGSVRVSRAGLAAEVTLKPGQQARIAHAGKTQTPVKVFNNVDLNKIMSWKNGLFNFEGASLEEIMRQVERWYDIEVIYEKGIPDEEFEGKVTKDVPLRDLLLMLERSGVHFRLENRKLIVLP